MCVVAVKEEVSVDSKTSAKVSKKAANFMIFTEKNMASSLVVNSHSWSVMRSKENHVVNVNVDRWQAKEGICLTETRNRLRAGT